MKNNKKRGNYKKRSNLKEKKKSKKIYNSAKSSLDKMFASASLSALRPSS